MPKPLLKRPDAKQNSASVLSAVSKNTHEQKQQAASMNKMMLDRILRKPRSKEYMSAIRRLDAGGHVHNQHLVNEIIEAIKAEFPEVELLGVMLAIVSICYLGAPYEVHTLDYGGGIIEHYKRREPMPGKIEEARSLTLRGGYEFIEVYSDCFRCVSSNGSVSVVSL